MTEPTPPAAEPTPTAPGPHASSGPSRPARPQYGEYATPQEVAAARGIPLDRGGEQVDRLATPIPVTPTGKKAGALGSVTRRRQTPAGQAVGTRPSPPAPLVTVLLLVFGIWNTVTAIPTFLDLGNALTQGLAAAGYGSVSFGPVAHVVGIALLVFSCVLLIAAVGLSFQRIRARRRSLWVPLVAGGVWIVGVMIGMIVVVANTPGITSLMQNHS
ncbi:MAG: hypothetical protein HIU88_09360 [Acidobacteria bacterium]|nr:hypothetical protein [Acidobacteriota bacterium]